MNATGTITHETKTVDRNGGTEFSCTCGIRSFWRVRDGSAEVDAHRHLMAVDAEYAEAANNADKARVSAWIADLRSEGCTCDFPDEVRMIRTIDRECPYHCRVGNL